MWHGKQIITNIRKNEYLGINKKEMNSQDRELFIKTKGPKCSSFTCLGCINILEIFIELSERYDKSFESRSCFSYFTLVYVKFRLEVFQIYTTFYLFNIQIVRMYHNINV